jgi:hypothetical protein
MSIYHGITIFIVYTDDTILLGPKQDGDWLPVKAVSTNFQDWRPRGVIRLLGYRNRKEHDGKLEWIQSTLIHSILQDPRLEGEGLKEQAKVRTILASSTIALINHHTWSQPKGIWIQTSNWRMVYSEKVNKARYNTPLQTKQSGDTYWKPRTKDWSWSQVKEYNLLSRCSICYWVE